MTFFYNNNNVELSFDLSMYMMSSEHHFIPFSRLNVVVLFIAVYLSTCQIIIISHDLFFFFSWFEFFTLMFLCVLRDLVSLLPLLKEKPDFNTEDKTIWLLAVIFCSEDAFLTSSKAKKNHFQVRIKKTTTTIYCSVLCVIVYFLLCKLVLLWIITDIASSFPVGKH